MEITRKPSRWRFLRPLIFAALWLVVLAVPFGAAGVYQGIQDRERNRLAVAAEHVYKARAHIQAGNLELALAELEEAYKANPDDPEIVTLAATLQRRRAVEPTPTLSAVSQGEILASVLAEARRLHESKDYDGAIAVLEGLRRVEPGYRKDEVERMLFDVYVTQARLYLSEDRWEEAVQTFDRALAVSRDDSVGVERYLAATYVRGLSAWGVDWQRAIESFAEIVSTDKEYRDAVSRLYQARVEYGEFLLARDAPCAAEQQFAAAIGIWRTAEIEARHAAAHEVCLAPPTPTPQPTATPGG